MNKEKILQRLVSYTTNLVEGLGIGFQSWGNDLLQAMKELTGIEAWKVSSFSAQAETIMGGRDAEELFEVPINLENIENYKVYSGILERPAQKSTSNRAAQEQIVIQFFYFEPDPTQVSLPKAPAKEKTLLYSGIVIVWRDSYSGGYPSTFFSKWVRITNQEELQSFAHDLTSPALLLKPLAKKIRSRIGEILNYESNGYWNVLPGNPPYRSADHLAYQSWKKRTDAFNPKTSAGHPQQWGADPKYKGDLPESKALAFIQRVAPLSEAPIEIFQPIGDFEKNSGFKDADLRIITTPKAVEKIKAMWNKTPHIFDLYFANLPRLNKTEFTEVGEVDIDFVRQDMKLDIQDVPGLRPNAITIIFTNNKGAERVMMTGWIMAHRVSHALRARLSKPTSQAWYEYSRLLTKLFVDILTNVYEEPSFDPLGAARFSGYRTQSAIKTNEMALKLAAQQLGTMKSARDANLRNWFEFAHELFAQYLLTGKITFNPFPDRLIVGNEAFGRKRSRFVDALSRDNFNIDYYVERIEAAIEKVLYTATGAVFVM